MSDKSKQKNWRVLRSLPQGKCDMSIVRHDGTKVLSAENASPLSAADLRLIENTPELLEQLLQTATELEYVIRRVGDQLDLPSWQNSQQVIRDSERLLHKVDPSLYEDYREEIEGD